ncbi:MAG: ribonuclease R [Candidatus Neomarinimicrobiota bacterium]
MRKKITGYLKKDPDSSYGKSELARLLRLSKSEHRRFRTELRRLVQEGKVLRTREGRYLWTGGTQKVAGILVLHHKGFGFVLMEDKDDVFVSAKKLRGAVHGDTVEVALLPSSFGKRPEGQVTRIVQRGTTEFIGTVTARNGELYLEIDTVTPRRGIHIQASSRVKISPGDAIVAEVHDWGHGREPIQVEPLKVIGSMKKPEDDITIVCYKFELEPRFSRKVLNEARQFDSETIQNEIPNRTDFRSLPCITIDPAEARDFDDAISLEKKKNGDFVMGIHIADVSFFVPIGGEIDREARRRGTSVYFSEGVVRMLPDELSADLCSLVTGKDRLAVTVLVRLNGDCDIVQTSFHSSVIRSARTFTYREVQSILDGKKKSKHSELLLQLRKISAKLLEKRQEKGSIDFDIPEPIFRFRNGGIPHEIHPSERLESHRIVEESMLLANRVVAEKVPGSAENERPFVYRVHDKPTKEGMDRFLGILRALGLNSGKTTHLRPFEFRNILSSVEDSPYKSLIESLALRTMTKAVYSPENRGHYGLAFETYTHFSSPIRRYPDLVVHRLLGESFLGRRDPRFSAMTAALADVARESTQAEIKAMEAERDYIKLKQIRWLSQRIGVTFEGIISGVVSSGFFVELKHALVEGFVHVDTLDDDYYGFDELDLSLVGKKSRQKYQMGKRVTIKVRSVSLEKRQADFTLLE